MIALTANEKGMAIIETLPVLVIFLVLFGYSFGMFGIIQTATLNSIGARVYAFETFRNRTDLTYFRGNKSNQAPTAQYAAIGNRLNMVISEAETDAGGTRFPASERPVAMGLSDAPQGENRNNESFHNDKLPAEYGVPQMQDGVAPAWIKVGYGICLNTGCGD